MIISLVIYYQILPLALYFLWDQATQEVPSDRQDPEDQAYRQRQVLLFVLLRTVQYELALLCRLCHPAPQENHGDLVTL